MTLNLAKQELIVLLEGIQPRVRAGFNLLNYYDSLFKKDFTRVFGYYMLIDNIASSNKS